MFWLFSAAVVTALVLGLVSLSTMFVQAGFQADEVQERIAALQDRSRSLTLQMAQRSSPSRIAAWARANDLIVPQVAPVVLRVRSVEDDSA